jgi:hypothetical protein
VKSPTQNDLVLDALLAGDVLTPLDALRRFGCFRLAARVADLRSRGFQIETISGEANGKRFAQYRLVWPADLPRPRKFRFANGTTKEART